MTMLRLLTVAVLSLFVVSSATAAERKINLGRFQVTAPADWESREPKSRIVAYEFAAPAAEGDKEEGRFTVMAAGGGVEANIDRWIGQFKQPDGSSTKQRTKIDKEQHAGQDVYVVDISGTYLDQPAPFAGGGQVIERENYRMLAAIITTDEAHFFLKFYGPRKTLAEQERAFKDMVHSLQTR